jgi:RNA chaperone Hfq
MTFFVLSWVKFCITRGGPFGDTGQSLEPRERRGKVPGSPAAVSYTCNRGFRGTEETEVDIMTSRTCRTVSVLLFLLLFFSTSLAAEESTMLPGTELQNRFIEALISEEIPVLISLTNFGEVEGLIRAHDASTILLENTRGRFRQRLIYKNTVSVIAPVPIAAEVLDEF